MPIASRDGWYERRSRSGVNVERPQYEDEHLPRLEMRPVRMIGQRRQTASLRGYALMGVVSLRLVWRAGSRHCEFRPTRRPSSDRPDDHGSTVKMTTT